MKNFKGENLNKPAENDVYYPHLKITNEKFPRLLSTRKFLCSKDEYFGAFLPKTALRIWFYQLNKIFRLRSCQMEIDGNFPQPCQMFFTKKCVAPCVSQICSKSEYDDYVQALRLFLRDDGSGFQNFVIKKIDEFSDSLEFEKAARWRDIWQQSQDLAHGKKIEISLENAVDTYSFEESGNETIFYLVTTRGRKFLGNREFIFPNSAETNREKNLEKILNDFYKFSAPREIRVPLEFSERKQIEKNLRDKFQCKTKIIVVKNELNKTAKMRFVRTKTEYNLEKIDESLSADEISKMIQTAFKLKRKPNRIEAFDVAHLSNQDFITANAVWEKGELKGEKVNYWKTDATNEPEAMAQAVKARLTEKNAPDLILIDGGKGQLNAVLTLLGDHPPKNISFISAVKPPGKHNEISHFLTADGKRIEFQKGEKVFELLRNLRDEAHRAANELHRQERDNKYIFAAQSGESKKQVELPLVILRFDEAGGAAEDLQPIKSNL
jgi:excinuclease ABC subunit C